jgi:exodeoxyribonuclease V alpha subunit
MDYAKGVGKATADAIWDAYGAEAVTIMADNPERVVKDGLLREADAAAASEKLREEVNSRRVTMELLELFQGRGFPRKLVKQCIELWGTAAAAHVKAEPFDLIKAGFKGVGFLRCDKLYLDLKYDAAAIVRQMFCIWYHLQKDSDGHTWHPIPTAVNYLAKTIGINQIQPTKALKFGVEQRMLAVWKNEFSRDGFVAVSQKANAEASLAQSVRRMLAKTTVHWPLDLPDDFTPHQREQCREAMRLPIGVLCGTPGTGKTFCAGGIARLIANAHGADVLACCAPTGKAAVRFSEALARYRVPTIAKTIHRLLGVGIQEDGDMGFEFGPGKQLPHRYVLVDEASMVDAQLMASLLTACPSNCHVLFVGDPNQLPPVGHGAPLRDFLATGLPRGELTEIKRNAGQIILACGAIRQNQHVESSEKYEPDKGHNVLFREIFQPDKVIQQLVSFMHHIRNKKTWDVFEDVQVIVAVNQKSRLSRTALNAILQRELNPDGAATENCPFLARDKIICLKNGFYFGLNRVPEGDEAAFPAEKGIRSWNQGGVKYCVLPHIDGGEGVYCQGAAADRTAFLANGEVGRVLHVEPGSVFAQFQAPERVVRIPWVGNRRQQRDDENSDLSEQNFDLAYAITGHKSQGSEWPVIISIIDDYPGASFVCSREWHYCVFSRGQQLVIAMGRRPIMEKHCQRVAIRDRKTFLVELLDLPKVAHEIADPVSGNGAD